MQFKADVGRVKGLLGGNKAYRAVLSKHLISNLLRVSYYGYERYLRLLSIMLYSIKDEVTKTFIVSILPTVSNPSKAMTELGFVTITVFNKLSKF